MSMSVGRCTGLRPRTVQRSGDALNWDGHVEASSAAELAVKIGQLQGLVGNPDEPVVPVTWDADTDVDGYWRVKSCSVGRIGPESAAKRARVSMSIERIGGGWAKPVFELALIAAPRSGGPGTLNPSGAANWLASGFPFGVGEAQGFTGLTSVYPVSPIPNSIATATGTIRKVDAYTSLAAATDSLVSYYAAPNEAYAGACTIEIQRGGAWYSVIGRQIPRVGRSWRISNGIVRLSLSTSTLGSLLVEVWGGAAWESLPLLNRLSEDGNTTGYFGLIDPSSNASTTAIDPVIVRNSAESVAVRIPQGYGNSETYSLGRGQPFASLHIPTIPVLPSVAGVKLTTPAAVTVITSTQLTGSGAVQWGMYTATDGNGNRLLVASPELAASAFAVDTVNGEMYGIDADTYPTTLLFGVTPDPTGGTTPEFETTAVAVSMFTAVAAQQQVVAR